jgi:purine-nucleoside phosphorylase
MNAERYVDFADIEGVGSATVKGHRGSIMSGMVGDVPVAVCAGRLHLYEGLAAAQVAAPVKLLAEMGVKKLLVTTAVGSLGGRFATGEMVAVKDQLNLTGSDPLTGLGVFQDASSMYDTELLLKLRGLGFQAGVLAGVRGPSYETPAEAAALATLGADLVCMSTVLEVIKAASLGMKTACLAAVANPAGSAGLNHQGVLEIVEESAKTCWPQVEKFLRDG